MKKLYFPTNQKIEYQEVRVIDADGKQVGIMSKEEAIKIAQENEKDLVLINAQAKPPIAKIVDLGKFLYDQKQKIKKISRPGKKVSQKELRLTPNIGKGDLDNRVRRAREFLGERNKVKFVIEFKGREMSHPEVGKQRLQNIFSGLNDIADIEKEPWWEGKRLMTIVKPK